MSGNLALDTNHDIIIGRSATRVGGAEFVAQLVKCRIMTLLGEWQNDTSIGLPWFDSIFTKGVRVADIQVAIANIIRSTNNVREVLSLDVSADYRERQLSISFTAISTYGDITELVTWPQQSTV